MAFHGQLQTAYYLITNLKTLSELSKYYLLKVKSKLTDLTENPLPFLVRNHHYEVVRLPGIISWIACTIYLISQQSQFGSFNILSLEVKHIRYPGNAIYDWEKLQNRKKIKNKLEDRPHLLDIKMVIYSSKMLKLREWEISNQRLRHTTSSAIL